MHAAEAIINAAASTYFSKPSAGGNTINIKSGIFAAAWTTIAAVSEPVLTYVMPKMSPIATQPTTSIGPPAIMCIAPKISELAITAVFREKLLPSPFIIIPRQSISSAMGARISRFITIRISPRWGTLSEK